MAKAVSAGLATHLAQSSTTLATCWKVTRTDGTVLAFTDHDRELTLDADGLGAVTYKPSNSFLRSAIETGEKLAVDHLDVVGVLDSAEITEADLIGGRYDNAEVKIFLVNWADLSQSILKERRGWLGEVDLRDFGFSAELLGLAQAYTDRIVELVSPRCMAELGDEYEVVTMLPFPFDIEATSPFDALKVVIGCAKTVANCIAPFDNIPNFRGFPFVPGQDATLRMQG